MWKRSGRSKTSERRGGGRGRGGDGDIGGGDVGRGRGRGIRGVLSRIELEVTAVVLVVLLGMPTDVQVWVAGESIR